MAPIRSGLLTVRVNADEMQMVKALAEAESLSASEYVRLLIRREHGERFGKSRQAAKRPKTK